MLLLRRARHARLRRGRVGEQARPACVVDVPVALQRRARAQAPPHRRVRPRLPLRNWRAQRRPHRHRRADGRPRAGLPGHHTALRARAAPIWRAHCVVPGRAAPARSARRRRRGGAPARVQRGAHEGERPAVRQARGDGQAVRVAGGAAHGGALRRVARRRRLHQRLRHRALLPRLDHRLDLRGHVEHAAHHHRQAHERRARHVVVRD
mmetsp:Transcript_1530/g.3606  ORF Transcript_1530/g.3606 Transcript_1530/m.3606 type:complete len:208 (-) Transcript_1530:106-729(-)